MLWLILFAALAGLAIYLFAAFLGRFAKDDPLAAEFTKLVKTAQTDMATAVKNAETKIEGK